MVVVAGWGACNTRGGKPGAGAPGPARGSPFNDRFFLLGGDMAGTHSVTTPLQSGRNSALFYYLPVAGQVLRSFLIGMGQQKSFGLSPVVASALAVGFLYNLRIAETLSLNVRCLIGCDRAVFSAVKGSRAGVLWLPGVDEQLLPHVGPGSSLPLFPVSYKKVWTQAKREGFNLAVPGHSNRAVTHISRYLTAAKVAAQFNTSTASDVLRHRSAKSVEYYLNS